jgi:simple sugar transport system permease protein
LRVDQLVSGLAINLVAAGLTSFLARLVFSGSSTQQLPGIGTIMIPGLANIPLIGPLLFQQDFLVYLLFILVILTTYLLFKTSFGLTLRAVGESPKAADTAGISVQTVRYIAVVISGCLASLGGAYLTLVQVRFFAEGMSAGKGFIAIAALIFGRWHPVGSALACLLFGATEALQLRIQALGANIPYQFLVMLPYVIALLALVGLAGKSTPPKALGTPYFGENRHSD